MALLDAYGRPVQVRALTQEQAAPSLTSVRNVWQASVANGLTPTRVASMIAAMEANDPLDYLTVAEEMEERDLHYASVLRTRKLAVAGLGLVVEAPTDKRADVKITDFVTEVLSGPEVKPMLIDLLDGLGKGFSVCEIMWDRTSARWVPEEYKWRDPRFFQFDREQGAELRLRDNENTSDGLPLQPYKFIQHRPRLKTGLTIRSGLARLALVMYLIKSYTVKDWLAFVEVFGMPLRLGKFAEGASQDQKEQLLRAVANLGTDAAAIIPSAMEIEFVESKVGTNIPFEALAEWCDAQVSKGVLGQTATTQGTPGRLGSDDAQHEVREDIRDHDAEQLCATLMRDLVRPLVDLNFGPKEGRLYPRLCLREEESEDLKLLSEALVPFIDRGLRVEASVIRDKFGIAEPAEGAEVLSAKASAPAFGADGTGDPTGNGEEPAPVDPEQARRLMLAREAAEDEIDSVTASVVKDWRKVLGPLLDPVLELVRTAQSYDELQERLAELTDTLPVETFVQSLATATFEARGLGDATDKVAKR